MPDIQLPYPDFPIRVVSCIEYIRGDYPSNAAVAELVGVCPATISRIMSGESRNMFVTTLYKFAQKLGVSADFLLGIVGPATPCERAAAKAVRDAYK